MIISDKDLVCDLRRLAVDLLTSIEKSNTISLDDKITAKVAVKVGVGVAERLLAAVNSLERIADSLEQLSNPLIGVSCSGDMIEPAKDDDSGI